MTNWVTDATVIIIGIREYVTAVPWGWLGKKMEIPIATVSSVSHTASYQNIIIIQCAGIMNHNLLSKNIKEDVTRSTVSRSLCQQSNTLSSVRSGHWRAVRNVTMQSNTRLFDDFYPSSNDVSTQKQKFHLDAHLWTLTSRDVHCVHVYLQHASRR